MMADFVLWFVFAMCEARAVWMLRDCSCCDVAYLTSSCHAQFRNHITSLDGAVFPAGLTTLDLVRFHDGRLCLWCVDAMCEARAVWMLRDCSCCDVASDVFVSCAEL